MNKGGDKPKKKFVISHSTYDDLPKKHWVDEKWMNRESQKIKQQNVVISHYMMDDDDLLQRSVGWLKNGWTERAYIKPKKNCDFMVMNY